MHRADSPAGTVRATTYGVGQAEYNAIALAEAVEKDRALREAVAGCADLGAAVFDQITAERLAAGDDGAVPTVEMKVGPRPETDGASIPPEGFPIRPSVHRALQPHKLASTTDEAVAVLTFGLLMFSFLLLLCYRLSLAVFV